MAGRCEEKRDGGVRMFVPAIADILSALLGVAKGLVNNP